jgi:hypothetical protein
VDKKIKRIHGQIKRNTHETERMKASEKGGKAAKKGILEHLQLS